MPAPPAPRMTHPTKAVLTALLSDPGREQYGLELGAAAGLPSGTIHPILARLEAVGWLESRWENADPAETGRPRRRYYRLTADGVVHAGAALRRSEAAKAKIVARVRPGLAGGGA
ncbi:MarR family transcriptional regulator [Saccharothrix sp.]|uniref:PadR family transcriptional regulator n=1 Tax=Saccharothrix sp. TaxID=1873460 RepID=UPI002810E673|nr:MarR family transcriptional regulator [Saccharothrix sp.]